METYYVDITVRASEPLTEESLFLLASLGGTAHGHAGDHEVACRIEVAASNKMTAAYAATSGVSRVLRCEVVGVEVHALADLGAIDDTFEIAAP